MDMREEGRRLGDTRPKRRGTRGRRVPVVIYRPSHLSPASKAALAVNPEFAQACGSLDGVRKNRNPVPKRNDAGGADFR